jgi:hypothetical protein
MLAVWLWGLSGRMFGSHEEDIEYPISNIEEGILMVVDTAVFLLGYSIFNIQYWIFI